MYQVNIFLKSFYKLHLKLQLTCINHLSEMAGVPKLNSAELETACEDFSNIVQAHDTVTVYKGTLSSGVEIAVASTVVNSLNDWSKRAEIAFRKKVSFRG